MDWREGEVRELALDEFDQRFARYRLQGDSAARQAMIASLRRFGQLSPVVVCELGGSVVLVDGFKRHDAAGDTKGLDRLSARRIEADEASAKAAMYGLNCLARRMHELEEAWIVYALVREDGLTQLQAAQLLGRHKSWACRRLAMLEKLSAEVRQELGLGLLTSTMARQLVRLPTGNQGETLAAARREGLSAAEMRGVVDLLSAAKSREQVEFVLEKPRQALRQASGEIVRGYDPRLSIAGNRVARRLAMLLDHLSRMETWLQHEGRAQLSACDRPILGPGFARLARDGATVSELARELVVEMQT
jgi:ParB-like chromosome segregation protein Spo0J